jgi:hypothetical protein
MKKKHLISPYTKKHLIVRRPFVCVFLLSKIHIFRPGEEESNRGEEVGLDERDEPGPCGGF